MSVPNVILDRPITVACRWAVSNRFAPLSGKPERLQTRPATAAPSSRTSEVTAPLQLAGLKLPVQEGCCHLDRRAGYAGANSLMFTFGVELGERRFISDADVLFVEQTREWKELDPSRVQAFPRQPSLSLLKIGARPGSTEATTRGCQFSEGLSMRTI